MMVALMHMKISVRTAGVWRSSRQKGVSSRSSSASVSIVMDELATMAAFLLGIRKVGDWPMPIGIMHMAIV